MKKTISTFTIILALALVGSPMTWAAKAVIGTVANIEIDEGAAAVTVKTEDGRTLVVQIDPAHVKDLKDGDRIEVSTEGKEPKFLKKL